MEFIVGSSIVKTGTKTQFLILILLGAFIYNFWEDVAISALQIYAISGHPHSKRLLGEYYAAKAREANIKATDYFQQALDGYKIKLPGTPVEHRMWIEFLIGTQYECGKGVEPDLEEARVWYQRSIKSGLPSGKTMFDQITAALIRASLNKHSNNSQNTTKK
jgi:hypothetical protein